MSAGGIRNKFGVGARLLRPTGGWLCGAGEDLVSNGVAQESGRHVGMFEQCGWTVEALVVET